MQTCTQGKHRVKMTKEALPKTASKPLEARERHGTEGASTAGNLILDFLPLEL